MKAKKTIKILFGHESFSAGMSAKRNSKIWHQNSAGNYWCGSWYDRTPQELLDECRSTIIDLIVNHPKLK